ncbi:MAG: hypothetical protein AAF600_22375 [Bacteroidota bacterium]
MSITKEELEKILKKELKPINDTLKVISKDLGEIRRDLGYDNLKVIKSSKVDDKEEM